MTTEQTGAEREHRDALQAVLMGHADRNRAMASWVLSTVIGELTDQQLEDLVLDVEAFWQRVERQRRRVAGQAPAER